MLTRLYPCLGPFRPITMSPDSRLHTYLMLPISLTVGNHELDGEISFSEGAV